MVSYEGEFGTGHYPGTTTNREVFGTWLRSFDFTLIVIGYTVGIHDFWRFPYLCYKFGAVFFIPFLILTIIIGIPTTFMEFTIGQYRGIGVTEVFGVMAPVITGVSYLLTWNSLTTCWIYTMMISWSRLYSSDATSCTQGWGKCDNTSYYNTEACYTGRLDEECSKMNSAMPIYYNFDCISMEKFCNTFDAKKSLTGKYCIDSNGYNFSIYTRRLHASVEYYYGGICGLKRDDTSNIKNQSISTEKLGVDIKSTSETEISLYSFTTFGLIAFFLYEDLLSVGVITYLLNVIPFFALVYFTIKAYLFSYSSRGIQELLDSFFHFEELLNPEIWVEAVIQVLSTAGIGNGVLINLSTFNKLDHYYLSEALLSGFLNYICSGCAVFICYCTIGQSIENFKVNIPFKEIIISKSSHSSLEFGYLVYTQFIVQIYNEPYTIMFFFFMITSFSMDSALRLVQNLLDAMVAIFARLRSHRLATLVGICLFGYVAILPMTRNGGVILFMEYEYFLLQFVWPFIVLIQVGAVTWVYKTRRILDNAEEMGINLNKCIRLYFTICLQYMTTGILLCVLVHNVVYHQTKRFNNEDSVIWNEIFGWVFVLTPISLFLLSVFEQLIAKDRSKWSTLLEPVVQHTGPLNVGRHSGISASLYGPVRIKHPEPRLLLHQIIEKWNKNFTATEEGKQIPAFTLPLEYDNFDTSTENPPTPSGVNLGKSTMASNRRLKKLIRKLKAYFKKWPGRFDDAVLNGDEDN